MHSHAQLACEPPGEIAAAPVGWLHSRLGGSAVQGNWLTEGTDADRAVPSGCPHGVGVEGGSGDCAEPRKRCYNVQRKKKRTRPVGGELLFVDVSVKTCVSYCTILVRAGRNQLSFPHVQENQRPGDAPIWQCCGRLHAAYDGVQESDQNSVPSDFLGAFTRNSPDHLWKSSA
jgi:hypothetical protein